MENAIFAPLETKFAEGAAAGLFSGYAAVFGNVDSHGDVIAPGAFQESLAEKKAQGRPIPMHVMHRIYGGDGLPVGVWNSVAEDDKGLRVEGKVSGMMTDVGQLLFERVKDGALGGLSIGYKVRRGGVSYGKKPGEPKRTLKALDLGEISLVDDASNALTRVDEVKAFLRAEMKAVGAADGADPESAAGDVAAAIIMLDKMMSNYFCGSTGGKDGALLMDRLRDAYEALTGSRAPDGVDGWTKNISIRDVEKMLRDGGLSHSQARAIAERGAKQTAPRDEVDGQANVAAKAALNDLSTALSGFSLPKF